MYLQIVCSCFFEEAASRPDEEITWEMVKSECMSELRPHFQYIWDRMPAAEKEILSGLASGGKIPPQQQHVGENLRRRGLINVEEGRAQVFSGAFGEFVLDGNAPSGGWLKNLFGKGRK